MTAMVESAIEIVGNNTFDAVFDKGYYTAMKRQWGFDHIITKKSIKRASADVGFIFIAYALKRIINSIGVQKLIAITAMYSIINCLKEARNTLKKTFISTINHKITDLQIFAHKVVFLA